MQLERFPEIVVRIAGGLPELPEGVSLQVRVTGPGRPRDTRRVADHGGLDSWLRAEGSLQTLGESDEVRVQVEGDGEHTVRVSVLNMTGDRGRTASVRGIEPARIDVRTALGERVFEIRIPDEGLREAIERVGRDP